MHSVVSTIEKVTIYSRGAMIERRGQLPKGETRFQIGHLPRSLQDSTLSVLCEGESASISGQRLGLHSQTPARAQETDLQRSIKEASKEVLRIEGDLKILANNLAAVAELKILSRPKNIGPSGEILPPSPSPQNARIELLRYVREESERLNSEMEQARSMLHDRIQELQKLQDTLNRLSSEANIKSSDLYKMVVAEAVTSTGEPPQETTELLIRYFVPAARWEPSYRLVLSADLKSFELRMIASVAQRTGEDWTGVQLSLSSADVQRWCQLPKMHSLRIGRAQAQADSAEREPPKGLAALYADYDRWMNSDDSSVKLGSALRSSILTSGLVGSREGPGGGGDFLDKGGIEPSVSFGSATGEFTPAAMNMPPEPGDAMLDKEYSEDSVMMSFDEMSAEEMEEPMPMMSMAPPPAPMRSKKRRGKPAPAPQAASVPISASLIRRAEKPAQPAFSSLRMASSDNSDRGSLVFINQKSVYTEYLEVAQIQFAGGVDEIFSSALKDLVALESLEPVQMGRVDVQLSVGREGYAHVYPVSGRVSVASDGDYSNVSVQSSDGESAAQYVCVPARSEHVFRTLRFSNPMHAPILSGPVDAYIEDTFLLGTHLKTTADKGEVEIGLGVEQRVKVVRNTDFEEVSAGLMGGKRALKHQIAIDVENSLPFSISLAIRERLPQVPEQEGDIELTIGKAQPPWQEFIPDNQPTDCGKQWTLSLDSQQRQKLSADYVIGIPAKMELVGGNRRNS